MIKVDLGGGAHPLTGFINVDAFTDCDISLDLNSVGDGVNSLPWDDGTVDAIHSSHCFEHLTSIHGLWLEIARVLKTGSGAEIRVPHWNNSQANMMGHVRTLSEHDIVQMYEFPESHWLDGRPWLSLHRVQYVPGRNFSEAKSLYPNHSRLQICKYVPDTCHEIRFHFIAEPSGVPVDRDVPSRIVYEVI